MQKRKIGLLAVLVMVVSAVLAFGLKSGAEADSSGHYDSSAGGLQCKEFVADDGNGGRLSVEVTASEWRTDVEHFRGAYATQRLIAQELTYPGNWVTVKRGKFHEGVPVVSDVSGGYATSFFYFRGGTDPSPRFGITVAGQDDLFRVISRVRVYSDEGAQLAVLNDVNGNCRL
jgi:hypothetical protein